MKKSLISLFVLLIIAGLGLLFKGGSQPSEVLGFFDPLNATYYLDQKPVVLVKGNSSADTVFGTASKSIINIFGEPVKGDLNGDGKIDAAVMLVQTTGGSGTFYYVAALINKNGNGEGTNAVLLGDRIAPQNILIKNGQIIANYADRNLGEPFTKQPSLGVSKYLAYDGSVLKESFPLAGAGEFCGGNRLNAPVCIAGYQCAPNPDSKLPFGDVGGTCVPK